MTPTNWAGNYTYRARAIHAPATLEQLQELVGALPRVRVLGSRHSFSGIVDSEELVTLAGMDPDVVVDRDARTVSLCGSVRYGDLVADLNREHLALANLASLPHIAVAGAVSTATHGSGDRSGNLATAVAGLQIVTSDGNVLTLARGDPDFEGTVVGLGAVGAVARVTLDLEPAYRISQRVFEGLRWEQLFEHFDAITSSGYSVSIFTRWGEAVDQVWVKNRVTEESEADRTDFFGATAATKDVHVIVGLDPINSTPQLGVPGPWSERLPHFRMGFTPSSGAEIQSEYIVPRSQAVSAIRAVRKLGSEIRPLILVSEIRTIAADELWMSPQYGQDTVAIHFTLKREPDRVKRLLVEVERALAPFEARPHWGKLFLADAKTIGPMYERLGDFSALLDRLDPRGAFRNKWLESRVLGGL
ncbi:MAG TPA: D-arabinono-1,4-lactone oxidase [Solirubrobacteraceae bacterium]